MSSTNDKIPTFWLRKASNALLRRCVTTLDQCFERRTDAEVVPHLSYWERPQILDTGIQDMKPYLEIYKYLDEQLDNSGPVRVLLTDGEFAINGELGQQLRQEIEQQFGKHIKDACPVGTMIQLEQERLRFPGCCHESVRRGVSSEEQQAARACTDRTTEMQFTRKTSISEEKTKRPMSNIARLCRGTSSKEVKIDINYEIIKAKVVAPNKSISTTKADFITPLGDNTAIRKLLRILPSFPIILPSKAEWKEQLLRMAYLWIIQNIKALIKEKNPLVSDADVQSLFSRMKCDKKILEKHLGQVLDQFTKISLYPLLDRWEPFLLRQVYNQTVATSPGSWSMEGSNNSAVGLQNNQKRKVAHPEEYARPTKQQKTTRINDFGDLQSSIPFATQIPVQTNQEISLQNQLNAFFEIQPSTTLSLEHLLQKIHGGRIAAPFIKELPDLLNRIHEICLRDFMGDIGRAQSCDGVLPFEVATGKSDETQMTNSKRKIVTKDRLNCQECGREQPSKKLHNGCCVPCKLKHMGHQDKTEHCRCDPNTSEAKAGRCIRCGKARMAKESAILKNSAKQEISKPKRGSKSLQTSEEPENGKRSSDEIDVEDGHSSKKAKAAAMSSKQNNESFAQTILSSRQQRKENIMRRLRILSRRMIQRDFGIDLPRPYIVPEEQIQALGQPTSFYPGVEPELQKAAGVSFSRKKSAEEFDKVTDQPTDKGDAAIINFQEATETSFLPLPQTASSQVTRRPQDNDNAQQSSINEEILLDQPFPTQVSYSIRSDISSSLPWPSQLDAEPEEISPIVTKIVASPLKRTITKRPNEPEKIAHNYYQEPLEDSDDEDDSGFVPEDMTVKTPPKADEVKDVQRLKFSFTHSMHNHDSVFAMRHNSVEVQKELPRASELDDVGLAVQVDQTNKDMSPSEPSMNDKSLGTNEVHDEDNQDDSQSKISLNNGHLINEDAETSQFTMNHSSEIQVLETPVKLKSYEKSENGVGAKIDRNDHTSHPVSSQNGTAKSEICHVSASFSTESGSAGLAGDTDTHRTQQSVIDLTSKSVSNESSIAIDQQIPSKLCKKDIVVPKEIVRTDLLQVAQYVGTLPMAQINALTEIDPENITEKDTNKFQQDFRAQWFQRHRLAKAPIKEVKKEAEVLELIVSTDSKIELAPTPEPPVISLTQSSASSDDSSVIVEFEEAAADQPLNKVTRDIHDMDIFSSEIDVHSDTGIKSQIQAKEDSPESIDHERLEREEIVAKLTRGISIADRKKRIEELQKELDEAKANFKPSKEVDIFSWTLF